MVAIVPTVEGPKIVLMSPVDTRLARARPFTTRMCAPRSRPASEAGLAG